MFANLPENNKVLLPIQIDNLSHKYCKSRSYDSCHSSKGGEQRQEIRWDFSDAEALPFNGSHMVIAGKGGLCIKNMDTEEQIEVCEGYRLSRFAPGGFLKDNWSIEGYFSLREIKNRKSYKPRSQIRQKAKEIWIVHNFWFEKCSTITKDLEYVNRRKCLCTSTGC